MAEDDDKKPLDPPADPPTPPADPPTPPANPPADPPSSYDDSKVMELIDNLTNQVTTLTAKVETLEIGGAPSDSTPVSRPWTARGRR